MTTEHVTSQYEDAPWAFDCLCGEDFADDLFWASFRDGTITNNPPGPDGRYYVICRSCGRIIDTETYEVVGRADVTQINTQIEELGD